MLKTIPIAVLFLAMVMFPRIGHAQTAFSGEPGVPGTPISPIPLDVVNFLQEGTGVGIQTITQGSVESLGDAGIDVTGYTDDGARQTPDGTPLIVVPGDVVFLTDPNGGDGSANWAAVVNFFNPSDPDGAQGLPATEDQAFFPANTGPGGFASFQLFPNTVYLTNPTNDLSQDDLLVETFEDAGPAGGFPGNDILFTTLVAYDQPVPEPATLSLLTIASVSLLARRRRVQPKLGGTP